ncbi:MAG: hypothetical protein ABIG37_00430 [Nanoarchaeota archaeon]|nr:hypothetical protein [Nanoarchaeota archaeon]
MGFKLLSRIFGPKELSSIMVLKLHQLEKACHDRGGGISEIGLNEFCSQINALKKKGYDTMFYEGMVIKYGDELKEIENL